MAKRKLNVAMIGYDFMGRAHSNAWRQVGRFFQDAPFDPVVGAIAGTPEISGVTSFGFGLSAMLFADATPASIVPARDKARPTPMAAPSARRRR